MIILLLVIGFILINKHDENKAADLEEKATPVGLSRARSECKKEGLSPQVCSTVTGSAGTTECGGQTCWIVYAHSKDENLYRAGVTVTLKDGKFVATDYLRDPQD